MDNDMNDYPISVLYKGRIALCPGDGVSGNISKFLLQKYGFYVEGSGLSTLTPWDEVKYCWSFKAQSPKSMTVSEPDYSGRFLYLVRRGASTFITAFPSTRSLASACRCQKREDYHFLMLL